MKPSTIQTSTPAGHEDVKLLGVQGSDKQTSETVFWEAKTPPVITDDKIEFIPL